MEHRRTTGDQDGAAIRAARKWRELSVAQVCTLLREREQIAIHPNSLRNIETNARGASPQLIGAIARALNVPKERILRDRPPWLQAATPASEPVTAGGTADNNVNCTPRPARA